MHFFKPIAPEKWLSEVKNIIGSQKIDYFIYNVVTRERNALYLII